MVPYSTNNEMFYCGSVFGIFKPMNLQILDILCCGEQTESHMNQPTENLHK